MAAVASLSPELERLTSQLARALVTAVRSWSLYPPEHPSLEAAVTRLHEAIEHAAGGRDITLGIAPTTVLLDGIPIVEPDPLTADAAAALHERDLVRLTFRGDVSSDTLKALLAVLAEDTRTLRERGGPAAIWRDRGHVSLSVEQIDYGFMLADRMADESRFRKDQLWFNLVRSLGSRQATFGEAAQNRLLEIASDAGAICELATDVMAPYRAADGSPMVTTQAAVVLSAFKHLQSIVSVLAPEQAETLLQNVAAATAQLDPRVVGELMRPGRGGSSEDAQLVRDVAQAFDDQSVAQLLATTLALDGKASERLAEIFATLTPGQKRKERVLSLTQAAMGQRGLSKGDATAGLWQTMDELLVAHDERPYVSSGYRTALDGAGARGEAMASAELPAELPEWVETVGPEHVRILSHTLLLDLLRLEEDPQRAVDLVEDVTALAEDQIRRGQYKVAADLIAALGEAAASATSAAREPARKALTDIGGAVALREAVGRIDEMHGAQYVAFRALCGGLGVAAIDALQGTLYIEPRTPARVRGTELIASYGSAALGRVAPLVDHPQWFVQRNTAELLALIAIPDCVPLLQAMLRGSDARVLREAVIALATINDPAAARAIHTVLRASTGAARQAVVDALVEARDPRVVPVLVRILAESQPLGRDHPIVLDTLDALGKIRDDRAVPPVAAVMRHTRWLARKKTKALKLAAVGTLVRIGTPPALSALQDASKHGDRLLRRIVRQAHLGTT